MTNNQQLLSDLARVKALFQQRAILGAMGIGSAEQAELQAFGEYRAHGGKLDFTAWQEQQAKAAL